MDGTPPCPAIQCGNLWALPGEQWIPTGSFKLPSAGLVLGLSMQGEDSRCWELLSIKKKRQSNDSFRRLLLPAESNDSRGKQRETKDMSSIFPLSTFELRFPARGDFLTSPTLPSISRHWSIRCIIDMTTAVLFCKSHHPIAGIIRRQTIASSSCCGFHALEARAAQTDRHVPASRTCRLHGGLHGSHRQCGGTTGSEAHEPGRCFVSPARRSMFAFATWFRVVHAPSIHRPS